MRLCLWPLTMAERASVGRPPGISRAGALAWTTAFVQDRQAYLGRRVTNTWNRAGITFQPFGDIFSDHMPFGPAGAGGLFRLGHLLDARQVLGQRSTIGHARL